MDLEDNNVNGEIAEKRDVFLQAEKEYLDELKNDPKNKDLLKKLNKYSASDLSKEADRRINCIENGEVKPENLERVETEITLIYAAIQDKIKEKEKEKEFDFEAAKREVDDLIKKQEKQINYLLGQRKSKAKAEQEEELEI